MEYDHCHTRMAGSSKKFKINKSSKEPDVELTCCCPHGAHSCMLVNCKKLGIYCKFCKPHYIFEHFDFVQPTMHPFDSLICNQLTLGFTKTFDFKIIENLNFTCHFSEYAGFHWLRSHLISLV